MFFFVPVSAIQAILEGVLRQYFTRCQVFKLHEKPFVFH